MCPGTEWGFVGEIRFGCVEDMWDESVGKGLGKWEVSVWRVLGRGFEGIDFEVSV